ERLYTRGCDTDPAGVGGRWSVVVGRWSVVGGYGRVTHTLAGGMPGVHSGRMRSWPLGSVCRGGSCGRRRDRLPSGGGEIPEEPVAGEAGDALECPRLLEEVGRAR